MRLSGKSSGYFIEINEYATVIARTSAMSAPLVVEQIEEFPSGDWAGLGAAFDKLAGPRRGGAYRNAVCGFAPERRFIRRASVDAKQGKEIAYLEELLTTQFRAEPDKMTFAILASADGSAFDPTQAAGKEVLFCGSYTEDFAAAQKALLDVGIFPDRLELTSVATLGGLSGVLAQQENKAPTLVLEIGRDITQCFIVNAGGVDLARPVPHGINSMIPIAQKELGLRDEEAAAKLLFSNTFDFTGMGQNLVKRLLKELQSSIGFFEVQTGQSIGQLYCSVQPSGFQWLSSTLASALGVAQFTPNLGPWAAREKITFAAGVLPEAVPASWLGVLALMARHQPSVSPQP